MLAGTEILLVEDDPLLRRRLTAFLEAREAAVTGVACVADARRALQGLDFEFVHERFYPNN